MTIKFDKYISDNQPNMENIFREIFPYTIKNDWGDDDGLFNNAVLWCDQNIGKSLYKVKSNKKGLYCIRSKKPKWDFWCNTFYFLENKNAMLFKLVFGGDYTHFKGYEDE
jgi:hypothetical protein